MPFGYDWTCDNCNYTIRTAGLFEFYRDELGLRHRYGHPFPTTDESKRSSVKGFTAVWYCTKCQQLREVVVVEFVRSQGGSLGACLAYDDPEVERTEFPAVCDVCNAPLKDDIEDEPCSRCGKGKFTEEARFMS